MSFSGAVSSRSMASHAACGAMRRKNCRSNRGRRPVLAQTPNQTPLLMTTPTPRAPLSSPKAASASSWASA
eukprot:10424762-Lingulodinium_polyedra.AAC.1